MCDNNLIIMENFEGTNPLAIQMRNTGEENKEEYEDKSKQLSVECHTLNLALF
jgi:hypothetical protein